ncbi:hypothetical protein PR048_012199 [Dryococelus australis]|uniref:Integrase zinc-binding domain-containing protein n=1 Tax=Dryococelus australis TaxID=614101 RepID=A0ABQ9HNR3_9NEOP|nr:hypothetical protein PR048_012199 [Dryococelus australis]
MTLVAGRNFEHLHMLEQVLIRFEEANLTLKSAKCSFGYGETEVLGHVVNSKEINLIPIRKRCKALELPVFLLLGFDIAKAQQGDSCLVPLIQEIKKPSTSNTKFSRYLYKINTRPESTEKLLVIPDKLKAEILSECQYNPLVGGHLGMVRSTDIIRRSYYWRGLFKDVESAGLLQPIPSDEPFDRIGIDLLDPFPKTTRGNKYFITCIDYDTRWEVALDLLGNVICRHSMPGSVLSDGIMAVHELLRLMDVQGTTSSYHPQCNGAAERLYPTRTSMISQNPCMNGMSSDLILTDRVRIEHRMKKKQDLSIFDCRQVVGARGMRHSNSEVVQALGFPWATGYSPAIQRRNMSSSHTIISSLWGTEATTSLEYICSLHIIRLND